MEKEKHNPNDKTPFEILSRLLTEKGRGDMINNQTENNGVLEQQRVISLEDGIIEFRSNRIRGHIEVNATSTLPNADRISFEIGHYGVESIRIGEQQLNLESPHNNPSMSTLIGLGLAAWAEQSVENNQFEQFPLSFE